MRTILRAGLGALLGVALVFSTAHAIEYDDIFELNDKGVSETTLVQLIVDDGRAFELADQELADLRAAGVSEVVIDAMLDPASGQAWLDGEVGFDADDDEYDSGGAAGYSTSLDQAYGHGYAEGQRTALVYSFGYYYGPLARYYYTDPFYYPFWSAGYSYSYWPSYYATWYRPYDSWYYAYPYNWYDYSSYYCHTYYDPGYWTSQGYAVQPGYGRTVWDDGPRWRDGGVTAPPKGGRPDGSVVAPSKRMLEDRLVSGGRGNALRGPSAPKQIREAITGRSTAPTVRLPGSRRVESGVRADRGTTVERSTAGRVTSGTRRSGNRDVSAGNVRRSPTREVVRGPARDFGRGPAVERRIERGNSGRANSGNSGRSVGRGDAVRRSSGGSNRGHQRVMQQLQGEPAYRAPEHQAPPAQPEPERTAEVRRDPPPPPPAQAPSPPPAREEDRSARGAAGAIRGGR